MESTLSSPCSRSDPLISRQALIHVDSLPPHDLVVLTDGSIPFPFDKGVCAVLANCSLHGTKAALGCSFLFGRPSMSSFPMKPAPFCKLCAGLDSSNKLPFLFFSILALSLQLCPLFPLFFTSNSSRHCLLFLFYQATMGPRTLISYGKRRCS